MRSDMIYSAQKKVFTFQGLLGILFLDGAYDMRRLFPLLAFLLAVLLYWLGYREAQHAVAQCRKADTPQRIMMTCRPWMNP